MATESLFDKTHLTRKGWIILGVIILFVVIVRVRLLDIPLERDEGEYAYMGQLLLQGIPPYGEAYNMKFPGTYLMYALIMAVFGQDIRGIHLGLMIVNGAAIILMYLLARKVVEEIPATVAGSAYGLLSLSSSVFGFAAHATHFVVLTAIGGMLLLLRAIEKRASILYFLSGLLLGISVIMKQPGMFFVLFCATYIIWKYFFPPEQSQPGNDVAGSAGPVRQLVIWLGIFCAGAALPLLITGLWLYASGVFDRFWFWTFVYASRYASQMTLSDALKLFKNTFSHVTDGFLFLWIFAALGLIVTFFHKGLKVNRSFVILLLVFSFLSICPGFYFREHYYVMLLPAVSLLASIFVGYLIGHLAFFGTRLSTLVGAMAFIAAIAIGLVHERGYFFYESPERLSGVLYFRNPFKESLVIANFIEERTTPDDKIAILGSEPEIFFYAKRRSATGYIYVYSLTEIHEYALPMQKEMISEVEASRPKFIIDVRVQRSWLKREWSEQYIFDWSKNYIADNYDLVGVAEMIPPDTSAYRWYDDTKDYHVHSEWYLLIYERK